jgi:hypothetical protein
MTSMPRIYVSSTLSDLQEYRKEATDVMHRMGVMPVVMEDFPASSRNSVEVCTEAVRNSDLVVLIIAHRYGVVPQGASVSMVELEFDAALQSQIPTLAFLVDDQYPWPKKLVDQGDIARRLEEFKERLQQQVVVEHITTPSDFGLRLFRALSKHLDKDTPPPSDETVIGKSQTEVLIRIEKYLQTLQTGFNDFQSQLESERHEGERSPAAKPMTINPPPFLGSATAGVEPRLCFVAMPYSKTWSAALQTTLADICRQEQFEVLVAKDMAGRFVPHDIWSGIMRAGIVIADITDGNPNVAYEIGLADVLGKEVILLCQGDTVPFDFLGQRLIQYRDTMQGTIKLREELAARLRQSKAKR